MLGDFCCHCCCTCCSDELYKYSPERDDAQERAAAAAHGACCGCRLLLQAAGLRPRGRARERVAHTGARTGTLRTGASPARHQPDASAPPARAHARAPLARAPRTRRTHDHETTTRRPLIAASLSGASTTSRSYTGYPVTSSARVAAMSSAAGAAHPLRMQQSRAGRPRGAGWGTRRAQEANTFDLHVYNMFWCCQAME